MMCSHPIFTLFPYTTLFRSKKHAFFVFHLRVIYGFFFSFLVYTFLIVLLFSNKTIFHLFARSLSVMRSEEHTSELQSHVNLVCRLLLEKKKNIYKISKYNIS